MRMRRHLWRCLSTTSVSTSIICSQQWRGLLKCGDDRFVACFQPFDAHFPAPSGRRLAYSHHQNEEWSCSSPLKIWVSTSCKVAKQERLFSSEKQFPLSQDLMSILKLRMASIEARYDQLTREVSEPGAQVEDVAKINKELSKLESSVEHVRHFRSKQKDIENLKMLVNQTSEDEEIRQMAADELKVALKEVDELQYEILLQLLPRDDADDRGCILEVRAGTGGEEASFFAMDIFKMYERFAQQNNWTFEVLAVTKSDYRGYKEASASVSGAGVYGRLKFESGVHRVQRVPLTEKSGRVHTSAASVAVLPQADEVDVQVRSEDLRIDTYRSHGAGGQHCNTTSSAVRVTHLPTGIVVAIQDERSQHLNRAKALNILRAKLYDMERSRMLASRSELRSEQIGSGDRSERIRTYNFPQGRVTDHRVGITRHDIEQIMQGEDLDIFIDALKMKEEVDALASFKAPLS